MSVNPTEYDLVQDDEIQELKDIVTTTYQEPDQSEYSYPVVDQGMNDEQWQYVALALGSGVMDEGGRPYWLKLNGSEANTNSTNTMLLTVSTVTDTAQASLRGFYHRLMADKVLDFPGVTSETTYYVALQYDPQGHKNPTGPISVKVLTRLDTAQGKHYLELWRVIRKPNQLLTDATIERVRPRAAPTQVVATWDQLPDASKCLWGSLFFVHETAETVMAVGSTEDAGGPTRWLNLTSPEWVESTSNAFPWTGHVASAKPAWRAIGDKVELRGRIKRQDNSDFNPGTDYTLIPNCPDVGTSSVMWGGSDGRRSNPIWLDSGRAGAGVKPTFRVKEATAWVDLTGLFYYRK